MKTILCWLTTSSITLGAATINAQPANGETTSTTGAALTSARTADRESKTTASLDRKRVEEIARMLPAKSPAMLPPISDREAWSKLARDGSLSRTLEIAEKQSKRPIPEQPDSLFLDFSRTGDRGRFQNVAKERRARLDHMVVAECVENNQRFMPAIDDLVVELCKERTWVLPAHDPKLINFSGTKITIDLASSAMGWKMALVDHLVGEELKPETRELLRDTIKKFVLVPFADMVAGKRLPDWWFEMTNNWNSVCFAGVVATVLLQVEDATARAEAIAAAEKYSQFFLSSFTPDGYCSEGMGYWNYGYGHYAMLTELVRKETDGKLDFMTSAGAQMPALYGARIQIINGISPAFADCSVNAKPAPELMWLVNERFDLWMPEWDELDRSAVVGSLPQMAVYYNAAAGELPKLEAPIPLKDEKLRTWFEKAGVLICRPADEGSIAVALKGGNNAENHNHNDLGSFVVVKGNASIILDPGLETYTARTFSSKRYDSKMLNSFGHPVPVVAGELQRSGAAAKAKIVRTDFTDAADSITFDMTSAYKVPELKKLERTFTYSRENGGALTVKDNVEYSEPKSFETALITLGKYEKSGKNTLLISDKKEKLRVTLDTGGEKYTVASEEIKENAPVQPTRIGIKLTKPVTSATVTMLIEPEK